jgi:polyamine oxidase
MSGASAANALVAAGYTVTILEARNRIGGRSLTDRKTLSKPVDLGAGWIHRADGNPITDLCKKYNIATTPTDFENAVLYGTDGKEVTVEVKNAAYELFKEVMDKVADLQDSSETEMSVGAAIIKVTKPMKLTAQQKLFLQYYSRTLSLTSFDESGEFDGESELVIGGYDGVV